MEWTHQSVCRYVLAHKLRHVDWKLGCLWMARKMGIMFGVTLHQTKGWSQSASQPSGSNPSGLLTSPAVYQSLNNDSYQVSPYSIRAASPATSVTNSGARTEACGALPLRLPPPYHFSCRTQTIYVLINVTYFMDHRGRFGFLQVW